MDTASLSVLFAVLSLACWGGTVAIGVLAVARRLRPASAAEPLLDAVADAGLWLGWVVATVAMAGSLYYSQVAHFEPCELCWFQRICMYPLAAILLVAAVRRDRCVWRYALPQIAAGALIAAYHAQLQAFPSQHSFCSTLNPCTTRYVWQFGFVSLPFMALAAFCFIAAALLAAGAAPPLGTAKASPPIGVS